MTTPQSFEESRRRPPRRPRRRPPVDALHQALDVQPGTSRPGDRPRRRCLHLRRPGQALPRRSRGPVHRPARARPHRARRRRPQAGVRARVLPLVVVRPPEGHRARGAPRRLRPRRPRPRLLHDRWRRGRRDRVEAGQAVLQADRQAHEAQGDQPIDRLPRHSRKAPCPSPASRTRRSTSSPWFPAAHKVPNTNFYRAPIHGTTKRPSVAGPPTASRRPSSSRAPTRSRPSSSSPCRTPVAASRRRPDTSSGSARSATSTT